MGCLAGTIMCIYSTYSNISERFLKEDFFLKKKKKDVELGNGQGFFIVVIRRGWGVFVFFFLKGEERRGETRRSWTGIGIGISGAEWSGVDWMSIMGNF